MIIKLWITVELGVMITKGRSTLLRASQSFTNSQFHFHTQDILEEVLLFCKERQSKYTKRNLQSELIEKKHCLIS